MRFIPAVSGVQIPPLLPEDNGSPGSSRASSLLRQGTPREHGRTHGSGRLSRRMMSAHGQTARGRQRSCRGEERKLAEVPTLPAVAKVRSDRDVLPQRAGAFRLRNAPAGQSGPVRHGDTPCPRGRLGAMSERKGKSGNKPLETWSDTRCPHAWGRASSSCPSQAAKSACQTTVSSVDGCVHRVAGGTQYGKVAQLVRACGSYPQCRGFKSLPCYQRTDGGPEFSGPLFCFGGWPCREGLPVLCPSRARPAARERTGPERRLPYRAARSVRADDAPSLTP